ncbi:MAG TPA: hypothetical protein VIJ79_12610 [Acidobacteriaceae bacterium]
MTRPDCIFVACASALAFALAGCGSGGVPPNPDGSFNIRPSTEIATGAWFLLQPISPGGDRNLPIEGFLGAFTASGSHVEGAFTTLSNDIPGNSIASRCLLDPTVPVTMVGTASNGVLTLDGIFEDNTVHLTGQLSADRQSLVSGSYSVAGRCATGASPITGNHQAPLTGTYTGTSVAASGATKQITATLTQGDYYYAAGYIPLTGTLSIGDANCTVSGPLLYAFLVGVPNEIIAYSAPNVGDNIRMYGSADAQGQTITVDTWEYYLSSCGEDSQAPNRSTILTRQ